MNSRRNSLGELRVGADRGDDGTEDAGRGTARDPRARRRWPAGRRGACRCRARRRAARPSPGPAPRRRGWPCSPSGGTTSPCWPAPLGDRVHGEPVVADLQEQLDGRVEDLVLALALDARALHVRDLGHHHAGAHRPSEEMDETKQFRSINRVRIRFIPAKLISDDRGPIRLRLGREWSRTGLAVRLVPTELSGPQYGGMSGSGPRTDGSFRPRPPQLGHLPKFAKSLSVVATGW